MLGLPEDVIIEIMGHLSVLAVINCRKVCQKLYELTNDRHLWVTIFSRTEGMLRPRIDPYQELTAEIGRVLVKSELLDKKWLSPKVVPCSAAIPLSFHADSAADPTALHGEYIVYRTSVFPDNTKFYWFRLSDMDNSPYLVYEIPARVVFRIQAVHELGLFCIVYGELITSTWTLLVFEISDVNNTRRPDLNAIFDVSLNPDVFIMYLYISFPFVYFFGHKPEVSSEVYLQIVNFERQERRTLSLADKANFGRGYQTYSVFLYNSHILQVFSIEEDTCVEVFDCADDISDRLDNIITDPSFTSSIPGGSDLGCRIFSQHTNSFTIVGFSTLDSEPPSVRVRALSVHLYNAKEWSVEELQSLDILGTLSDWILPSCYQARTRYALGILLIERPKAEQESGGYTGTSWKYACYALRVEIPDHQLDGEPRSQSALSVTLIDFLPEEEGQKDIPARIMDFDPVLGVALISFEGSQESSYLVNF